MIKKISFFLMVFMSGMLIKANTPVSGGIFTNTTWTLANSPYIVTGNVVVFPGVTLTIQPGVEVRVKMNPSTTFGYHGSFGYVIEARGTINAIGTSNAKITFKSDTTIAGQNDLWRGFIEKRSQNGKVNLDYTNFYNAFSVIGYDANPSSMVFHESKFENNAFTFVDNFTSLKFFDCQFKGNINVFQGLCQSYTFKRTVFDNNQSVMSSYANGILVDSCSFTNNGGCIQTPYGGVLQVKNTLFKGNGFGLAFPSGTLIKKCKFIANQLGLGGSYATVDSCVFDSNIVAINAGEKLVVNNCKIVNNQKGIVIFNFNGAFNFPNVLNNKICNNSVYNIENSSDKNLSIPSNCFCETDSAIIESKIFDGYDDPSRGLISYNIYDSTCVGVVQVVNKLVAALSTKQIVTSNFKLYPNPSGNFVTLENTYGFEALKLLTLTGAELSSTKLTNGKNLIDLSHLPKGIYQVKVLKDGGGEQVLKLVKSE